MCIIVEEKEINYIFTIFIVIMNFNILIERCVPLENYFIRAIFKKSQRTFFVSLCSEVLCTHDFL